MSYLLRLLIASNKIAFLFVIVKHQMEKCRDATMRYCFFSGCGCGFELTKLVAHILLNTHVTDDEKKKERHCTNQPAIFRATSLDGR